MHGPAVDVAADGHLERVGGPRASARGEDVAQRDELAVDVRDLDADGLAARDRRQDAHVGRRHRVGDVLVQARDAGDLHARPELELVAGDGRADDHADEAGLDAVLRPAPARGRGRLLDGRRSTSCAALRSEEASTRRQLPAPPSCSQLRPGGRPSVWSRKPAACSKRHWPRTASRPASSAWWSAHRHPLRARARPGREGRPRHQPPQGHRLRHGVARRAHPGADPRPPGDRRRGPQQAAASSSTLGDILAREEATQGHPPARGGDRPRHQRPGGDGRTSRPCRTCSSPAPRARASRAASTRIVTSVLMRIDARSGADDPRRPEAGRARPVQPAAHLLTAGRDEPQEGGERAGVGGRGDGASLRPARRGRRPRHHRLQRGVRPRRPPTPTTRIAEDRRSTNACRSSSSSSTS